MTGPTTAAASPYPDTVPMPVHTTAPEILELDRMGETSFRSRGGVGNHMGTIFGGRLLAQSLAAAVDTVPEMPLTSAHAYFLAAGMVDRDVEYRVTRLRDSRRFANRQVTAWQDDRQIFTLMAQFHAPEHGFTHQQASMPDVPAPDAVMPLQQYVQENADRVDLSAVRNFSGAVPIEMRPIEPESYFFERREGARTFWFRMPGAAQITDPRMQQCLLAYASDYWLGGVTAIPHAFPTNGRSLLISSLDHGLWFHRPARCDEWLLHHTTSPSAGEGLGLAQGRIFDVAGRLIATTTQECLLRRLSQD